MSTITIGVLSDFRGVAAAIPQPTLENSDDFCLLPAYVSNLTLYNAQGPRIAYRDSVNDQDIVEAVYRWDDRDYNEIFRTGFRARPRGETTHQAYYNLEQHVNGAGAPTDTSPAAASVFVSTTRLTRSRWRPMVTSEMIIYQYEIFAPGGIDTVMTLRDDHDYPNQQEIAFVGAIDPQYIRSARPYVAIPPEADAGGPPFPGYAPYGNRIYRNGNFNPNPIPSEWQTPQEFMNRLRNIRCPNDNETMINVVFTRRITRDISATDEVVPYIDPACYASSYVDCAFNCNWKLEAFIFTADQCMRINYAPGSTDDYVIKGPMNVGDYFPALQYTIFDTGIDAAFNAEAEGEVYMFRNNIYVLFNYEEGRVIGGPKFITDGFHSLKGTIFEHGIDAAFASHRTNEAYLFRGDQYVLIDYAPGTTDDRILNGPLKIVDGYPSLKGTVFTGGLDAAFRAYAKNEAYIFKNNSYALINYAPGTTDDKIINQVTPIKDGFHSLSGFVPRLHCGC